MTATADASGENVCLCDETKDLFLYYDSCIEACPSLTHIQDNTNSSQKLCKEC